MVEYNALKVNVEFRYGTPSYGFLPYGFDRLFFGLDAEGAVSASLAALADLSAAAGKPLRVEDMLSLRVEPRHVEV